MRTVTTRIGLLVLLASASCDHAVTAPASNGRANRTLLSSPTTVDVVTRSMPLATSQSATAVIGAFGGQLTIPGAGLSVVVPPFALNAPTRITVTAVAGSQVAYEFEPHGAHFLVPLLVTQDLAGTSALSGGLLPKPLVAGYFANLSDLDPLAGTGVVSELVGTSVSLLTGTVTFAVTHFSGYLVATGDGAEAPAGGTNQ